jgi:hypothetical protein
MAGCTSPDTVATEGASVSDFAASLGPCETSLREGPNIYEFLAAPGAWLKVERAEAVPGATELDDSRLQAELEYVGGDTGLAAAGRSAAEGDQPLVGSEPMARLVAKATIEAQETFVKVAFEDGASGPEILYSVAFDASEDFAFVGNCKAIRYVEPLTERFGDDARRVVRALVGADAATTRELLQLEPTEEQPIGSQVVLNEEGLDAQLLEGLQSGTFLLADLPESWLGEYGICTKIERGWSPCLFLRDRALAEQAAPMWFDPENPVVEVWLTNGGLDLEQPIARLGEVDLREAISTLDGISTVQVAVTLPPASSVAALAERGGEVPTDITIRAETVPL